MTDARDAILAAVRAARPPAVPMPDIRAAIGGAAPFEEGDIGRFTVAARAAGGEVVELAGAALGNALDDGQSAGARILSVVPDVASSIAPPNDVHALSDLDCYVCEAALGVAENGAVWVDASRAVDRAALFLASQVVVVLRRAAIVPDMHAAYARLPVGAIPFGLFIAGPSKTADIEQSLVIGAHGPKGLRVLVV